MPLSDAQMMHQGDDRVTDSPFQPPIEKEKRGMIELILDQHIQLRPGQDVHPIPHKILQQMPRVVAPGHREEDDLIPLAAQKGRQPAVVEITAGAGVQRAVDDQTDAHQSQGRSWR